MRKFEALVFFLILVISCFAQETNHSYLFLPINNEGVELKSNALVKVKLFVFPEHLRLKEYDGKDKEIKTLSKTISFLSDGNREGFLNICDTQDTSVVEAYNFYSIFLPRSENPKVSARLDLGEFKIYFVNLQEGFPLMTFCLRSTRGKVLNHPLIMDHPSVVSIINAINKHHASPDEYVILKSPKIDNFSVVRYDTIYGRGIEPLEFYFDISKVIFRTEVAYDSSNVFETKYDKILHTYKKIIMEFEEGLFDSYFNILSKESRDRIGKNLVNASSENRAHFTHYKSSFNKVVRIIDLGETKILLTQNSTMYDTRDVLPIYFRDNNQINWINEQFMFYLDDLMETEEFKAAIFPSQ